MSAPHRPHPSNVPGAFYVVDGCCTRCGVPDVTAPEHFADTDDHCFVRRQPATPRELDRVLLTVLQAEFRCVRYRGDDPDVLRRLAEMGEAETCDHPPPPDVAPVLRRHATFEAEDTTSARELLAAFGAHLARLPAPRMHVRPLVGDAEHAVLEFAWFEDDLHEVRCRREAPHWHVQVDARAVATLLDGWLEQRPDLTRVGWFSDDERACSAPGRPRPW